MDPMSLEIPRFGSPCSCFNRNPSWLRAWWVRVPRSQTAWFGCMPACNGFKHIAFISCFSMMNFEKRWFFGLLVTAKGAFLISGWFFRLILCILIFILLGKLAGKHEYVCNVHLSKMSPFWLKWNCDHHDQKKTCFSHSLSHPFLSHVWIHSDWVHKGCHQGRRQDSNKWREGCRCPATGCGCFWFCPGDEGRFCQPWSPAYSGRSQWFWSDETGVETNGRMISLTPLSKGLILRWNFGLHHHSRSSRSSLGYYNILMHKVIFLDRSQSSLPLLLLSWRRGGRVSTGSGWSYSPRTLSWERSLSLILTLPTCGLRTGDLVGLCQLLALLVRLDIWSTWQGPFWIRPRTFLVSFWHLPTGQSCTNWHPNTEGKSTAASVAWVLPDASSVGLFSWLADIFQNPCLVCWQIEA